MSLSLLDHDIELRAQYHCDQHVVEMILQSVQIPCIALDNKGLATPYRSTHNKHPCVLWAGESYDNFLWLKDLAPCPDDEYRYRFDKHQDHPSIAVPASIFGYRFTRRGLTFFAPAMTEKYRIPGDAVTACRRFYIGEKQRFARQARPACSNGPATTEQ